MRAVRVWIKKEGRAKYISHLDLNRCFARAVRRAGLDLWYTEGFNPHPYLNFLTPLSLGQESEGEPLDIRVESDMTDDELLERFASVLPEGITVTAVCEPVSHSSEIAAAEYDISLELADDNLAAHFAESVRQIIAGGVLTAEKQGKKGGRKVTKEINLCESVKKLEATTDGVNVCMNTVLAAGNISSLNPALLISALENETGIHADYVLIRRLRLLRADGTEFN